MKIRLEHVDDLARGAAILGTGGGGDPYLGSLMLRQAIRDHGPIFVNRICMFSITVSPFMQSCL